MPTGKSRPASISSQVDLTCALGSERQAFAAMAVTTHLTLQSQPWEAQFSLEGLASWLKRNGTTSFSEAYDQMLRSAETEMLASRAGVDVLEYFLVPGINDLIERRFLMRSNKRRRTILQVMDAFIVFMDAQQALWESQTR